jgi:FG-GAP-like repeat/ASPIC and UnbV
VTTSNLTPNAGLDEEVASNTARTPDIRAPSKRSFRWVRWALSCLLLLLVLGATALHLTIRRYAAVLTNAPVTFANQQQERQGEQRLAAMVRQNPSEPAVDDLYDRLQPFREIAPFDQDANDHANTFDGYGTCGVLIFDANGDGRLDVNLTHNGDNWTRPTDDNGVLAERRRPQRNGLYLNMGNQPSGEPILVQVSELTRRNETYQREELLPENFLFPRSSPDESLDRVGRIATSATAADLNGDGRLDLMVSSILPGMIYSHPTTQSALGQFVRPFGRKAVHSKAPLTAQGLGFLAAPEIRDERNMVRPSARGQEPYGANSVFLNMGDADGDGVPEWRDVTDEYGLGGSRSSAMLSAADIDLDGDLDVYEINAMDPDLWPGGATALAGAPNMLYINQLAETGRATFVERGAEMDVDGRYDEDNPVPDYYRLKKLPLLPRDYSVALGKFEPYKPDLLEVNGYRSEAGEISWATVWQDVNDDGYPDLWVANDLGFLRLHVNQAGKRFIRTPHARSNTSGFWMSLSPADFNGDLKEDLFAGNMGGATMNLSIPIPDLYSLFDPDIVSATLAQQFFGDSHDSMHALIDGANLAVELKHRVWHSKILPPDSSIPNNLRTFGGMVKLREGSFDPGSIDPYEFAWGTTVIDVQNDGLPDLYWIGSLFGRGGGIFPVMGTGPGRLLVNATQSPQQPRLVDMTVEHHVLNIMDIKYDKLKSEGYIYRDAPAQNWGKRSVVRSGDVSVWGVQGVGAIEHITNQDLIQTSENGRGAISGDLNDDGFADMIVTNLGGYDSRSPKATNLKAKVDGKIRVIPAHDANFPTPTNYEAGPIRVFLNTYSANNWIKIELIDDTEGTFNRFAVGAKVVVNDKQMAVQRSGNGGFISNYFGPLLIGLGSESARSLVVRWPDRARTETRITLPGHSKGTLRVRKSTGQAQWVPKEGATQ